MATVTFLQTVNGVMRRLRETTVSSVTETDYSTLIGEFVNDSRDYVENRWDWIGLEQTITITTASGVVEYTVDGAGESGNIEQLIDDTNNLVLTEVDIESIRREREITDGLEDGKPVNYAFSSVASDLDPQIMLRPRPDGVYTLKAHVNKSGVALSAGGDVLVVPSFPVIQLAYALALDERGETGGTAGRSQFALAETYIANAIMRDVQKRPFDTTWRVQGERPERTNFADRFSP